MQNYVITIARGYGSGGKTIGQMLSSKLGIKYYDKDLIKIASDESGINEGLFGNNDEKVKRNLSVKRNDITSTEKLFQYQSESIKKLAENESCIIIGRCADYILKDQKNIVKLYIYADFDYCVDVVCNRFGYTKKESEKKITAIDKERSEYYKFHTGHDWKLATNYDMCLNSAVLGFDKVVEMVEEYINIRFGK